MELRICIVHDEAARNAIITQQYYDLVMNYDGLYTEILTQDERIRAELVDMYPNARRSSPKMGFTLISVEQPLASVVEDIEQRLGPVNVDDLRFGPQPSSE